MIVQPKLLNFQCRRVYVHVHESQNKSAASKSWRVMKALPAVACCLVPDKDGNVSNEFSTIRKRNLVEFGCGLVDTPSSWAVKIMTKSIKHYCKVISSYKSFWHATNGYNPRLCQLATNVERQFFAR